MSKKQTEETKKKMRQLQSFVNAQLQSIHRKPTGFILVSFTLANEGEQDFLSNCEKEDALEALEGAIHKMRESKESS